METILNGTSGEFYTLCKYMYIFVFFLNENWTFQCISCFLLFVFKRLRLTCQIGGVYAFWGQGLYPFCISFLGDPRATKTNRIPFLDKTWESCLRVKSTHIQHVPRDYHRSEGARPSCSCALLNTAVYMTIQRLTSYELGSRDQFYPKSGESLIKIKSTLYYILVLYI